MEKNIQGYGRCPVCYGDRFSYHAKYRKYHYQRSIKIIRVRCRSCHSTHALIPEFSLPGTSIGTKEAEKYIHLRQAGVSQRNASKVFTIQGMSGGYGIRFEQMVARTARRSQALFPLESDSMHDPIRLSQPASSAMNLLRVNDECLQRGYNPLFFSRRNILQIRTLKLGRLFPLNTGAVWSQIPGLDSS